MYCTRYTLTRATGLLMTLVLLLFLLAAPVELQAQDRVVKSSTDVQQTWTADDTGAQPLPGFAGKAEMLFSGINNHAVCPPSGSISGSLEPGDSGMPVRIFRDGVASTCGGKAFPGTFGGPNVFDQFGPYLVGSAGTCVTVNFDTDT
ncbi:MAG: hypothetical protein IH820_06995, partial [Bacteroidetes bacterium]|nr:hypothetical protein [Bacteroidota bacterium]